MVRIREQCQRYLRTGSCTLNPLPLRTMIHAVAAEIQNFARLENDIADLAYQAARRGRATTRSWWGG